MSDSFLSPSIRSWNWEQSPTYRSMHVYSKGGTSVVGFMQGGFYPTVIQAEEVAWEKYGKQNFPRAWYRTSLPKEKTSLLSLWSFYTTVPFAIDVIEAELPFTLHLRRKTSEPHKETPYLLVQLGDWIEAIQPKVFVIKTDPRLAKGKARQLLNSWKEWLEDVGYIIDLEVLNTQFYQVAQDKDVLVIMGVRKDGDVRPMFPQAMDSSVTTADVLASIRFLPNDFSTKKAKEEWMEQATEEQLRKRNDWNAPFKGLKPHFHRPIHPLDDRLLSVWEAMRLQGLPDDFILSNQLTTNWAQITSTSPVWFNQAIANQVRFLLDQWD